MTNPAPTAVTTETTVTAEPEKTFTQADMDRVVAERVNRTKSQYQDYAELKAKADKLAKIEADNATETEKAVKAARDEGRNEVLTATNQRLVNAEARALAAEAKARNPAVAVRSLDLADVKVGDDGTVDAAAIKAKLDELVKSDSYLFGDPPPPPPPTAGQAGIGVTGGSSQPTNPRAADLAQIEADMKAGARRT